jgi:5-methylcytosine-specific restriction endonuclease McrA
MSANRRWWKKYNRYLNRRDWQHTRKAALKRDRYRCRRCGTRGNPRNPLQANHLSYAVYNATGHTPLADLETLCRRCHQKLTGRRFKKTQSTRPTAIGLDYSPRRNPGLRHNSG